MTFASSSVKVLFRKIFFTRRVFPDGRITPVVGIGGSPSFCCKLSAITRKTLRPMFILFRKESFKMKKSVPESIFFSTLLLSYHPGPWPLLSKYVSHFTGRENHQLPQSLTTGTTICLYLYLLLLSFALTTVEGGLGYCLPICWNPTCSCRNITLPIILSLQHFPFN